MIAKIAVLLLASCAMTMAQLPSVNDYVGQLQSVPQQSIQYVQQAVGEVADRLGGAYVNTYDAQKNSVDQTLDTVKTLGQKGVESGVNLFKNGLDFLFILPTFTRHALANGQQQSVQQLLQQLQLQQQQQLQLQQQYLQQQQQQPQQYLQQQQQQQPQQYLQQQQQQPQQYLQQAQQYLPQLQQQPQQYLQQQRRI